MWFVQFDLSCGLVLLFVGFFCGCSNGGVVGFGWWLCGVLGFRSEERRVGKECLE